VEAKRIMSGKQLNVSSTGEAVGVSVYVTVSSSAASAAAAVADAEPQVKVLDGGTRLQLLSTTDEASVLVDATYDRVRVHIST
jgi:restriction endonuclease Mrr